MFWVISLPPAGAAGPLPLLFCSVVVIARQPFAVEGVVVVDFFAVDLDVPPAFFAVPDFAEPAFAELVFAEPFFAADPFFAAVPFFDAPFLADPFRPPVGSPEPS